jgi:[pyruvate, water dikinase]-phosphate phosphotransferase / [pyruvate, water dikinase] kinase
MDRYSYPRNSYPPSRSPKFCPDPCPCESPKGLFTGPAEESAEPIQALHACPQATRAVITSRHFRTPGAALGRSYFHLHLVSDSTGETLIAASRAASAQYQGVASIEHVYPLIRTQAQLDRVIAEIENAPGIVLFTLVDSDLSKRLEQGCAASGSPCLSVLGPILTLFKSYLGQNSTPRAGAQHMLNAEYFKRIDALNFSMISDDGQAAENLDHADIVLLGVSRTSKTPTSIYLANRGYKTANVPLVPHVPLPRALDHLRRPLIVGLIASADRIVQIRQNRLLSLKADAQTEYVDRTAVAEEVAASRRLFAERGWPTIDVTRRSIEETAAAVLDLYRAHRLKFIAEG